MNSPTISTERLYLERIEENHFECIYSLVSNEKVQQHFPATLNREEARKFYDEIRS